MFRMKLGKAMLEIAIFQSLKFEVFNIFMIKFSTVTVTREHSKLFWDNFIGPGELSDTV